MTESAQVLLGATPRVNVRSLGAFRRTVREIGLGMITVGVAILLFVVYQLFGTSLTERHDQQLLRRSFDHALAVNKAKSPPDRSTVPAPAGAQDLSPSTPVGRAIDHLVIPSIHVDKFVVQGTAEADLSQGPGHYVDTPLPGQKGNVAIAGHRTTYGAPFYELGNLHPGDYVYLTNTAGRTFDYKVVHKEVVSPDDSAVLDDTPDAQLTLTTCNPPYSATSRLIVVARLVGRPAPPVKVTTPARPKTTGSKAATASKSLGHGNASAWPPAVAYGAAAAALWVLTRLAVNRSRRWRRAGSLTAGILLCAIPLWFCFENVVRLLPPSI